MPDPSFVNGHTVQTGNEYNFFATVWSGNTAPTNATGALQYTTVAVGDLYVRTDVPSLYRCTTGGGVGVAVWALIVDNTIVSPLGTNTATNGAAILTALSHTSTIAYQLSDTTRDYEVYADCTTAGTAFSLSIGHTSGASDLTIVSSTVANIGDLYCFHLPAGWYYKFTFTTAVFNVNAVSC